MSYITEVLIHGAEDEQLGSLNDWLREHDPDRQQQFQKISMEAAGGTKYYVTTVAAAAFNYMPVDLLGKLRDPATWGNRIYLVAVIIDGEEDVEAFVFEKVEGVYQPVTRQEWRA